MSNSGGREEKVVGNDIVEFSSHGVLSLFPSPPRSLNLPIGETPEVPWDDPKTWASVRDYEPQEMEVEYDTTKGKRKTKIQDWTQAFQKAIDSGKTTVYFPKGAYDVVGTVHIRGAVRRIIGMESTFSRLKTGTLVMEKGDSPVVRIERFDWMYSQINISHAAPRRLVVSTVLGGSYETANGNGGLFLEDVVGHFRFHGGQVWARQINTEGGYKTLPETPRDQYAPGYDLVLNDGARLWMLGFKTEGDGTPLTNVSGAATEILGGFVYANKNYRAEKQWVINDNSALSMTMGEFVIRKEPFDLVLEKRDGKTRVLKKGEAPGRGGGSMSTLYTGYQTRAAAAPSPLREVASAPASTSRVVLRWQGGDGAHGIAIERAEGDDWRYVASASGDATEYSVAGLAPNTKYQFRLTPFSGANQAAAQTVSAQTQAPPPPGQGLGLRADYYNDKYFRELKATRTEAPIQFDWSAAPPADYRAENYGVRWTGMIEPRFSETYTFNIASAGQLLWIGDELVIDAAGSSRSRRGDIKLQAGQKYPIKLEMVATKNAKAELWWQSPSLPRELVPAGQLYPAPQAQPELQMVAKSRNIKEGEPAIVEVRRRGGEGALEAEYTVGGNAVSEADYKPLSGTITLPQPDSKVTLTLQTIDDKNAEPDKSLSIGLRPSARYNIADGPQQMVLRDDDLPPGGDGVGLKAEYFSDAKFTDLVTTRSDKEIDFDWNKSAPVKGIDTAKPYGIRWTGQIQPLFSGAYTFIVNGTSYGSQKLWIDGKEVLSIAGKNAVRRATVDLKAGQKYPIKLEYTNAKTYGSRISLLWSSDQQFEQVVPKAQLYPTP